MGKRIDLFGKQEKQRQAIPLRDAMLCMDCEMVFEAGQACCPVCASEVFLSVSLALSDDETKAPVRELADKASDEFFGKYIFAGGAR
jgi:predicted amidophosphoribosyltransferase